MAEKTKIPWTLKTYRERVRELERALDLALSAFILLEKYHTNNTAWVSCGGAGIITKLTAALEPGKERE